MTPDLRSVEEGALGVIKIVIPDDSPSVFAGSEPLARLQNQPGVQVEIYTSPPADEDDLVRRIEDAHSVLNVRGYCKFPASVLRRAPGLKHLAVWGTGVDNIDLEFARQRGIVVSNTPDTATDAVAEHNLALMLAVARRIPELDRKTREGQWTRGSLIQLAGKTLGILGTGVIGCRMAQLGKGIGMKVLAWTFHPDPEKAERFGFRYAPLDEVLSQSDVISLHLRSSAQTRHFLNADRLRKVKPGALLINTGRGDLVDEQALVAALQEGRLAGAGLDVFEEEPLPADHPLTRLPHVVLSPHTAGTTPEALANGMNRAIDNLIAFLNTGEVLHRVV